MILNINLISTKENELEKIENVMKELYSFGIMFETKLVKNYEKNFEYENVKIENVIEKDKRQIVNNILNNASSDILILDLSYNLNILKDVIKTTFENKCDYIYFYGKVSKFERFFEKIDATFFNFYLNLKKKARYLDNLNTLSYISFRILKVMRTCDEEYSYLQNTESFKNYDVVYHELDAPKKFKLTNFLFPLISLFNIALVAVLLINMIKYFKTTNTILNMVIICLFVFILLFGYSFLIYYHIKFKKLLKRGNDE